MSYQQLPNFQGHASSITPCPAAFHHTISHRRRCKHACSMHAHSRHACMSSSNRASSMNGCVRHAHLSPPACKSFLKHNVHASKNLTRSLGKCLNALNDEIVVGIDLGTTNSAVSIVENGLPIVVPNDEGHEITPSVVSFGEGGEVLVGMEAKKKAAFRPKTTFYSVKRFIGRRYSEVKDEIKLVPFKVNQGPSGEVLLDCPFAENGVLSPEQVQSFILSKLIKTIEKKFGRPVKKAVISVPAYFDEAQRKATTAAGTLAGLEKVRLIKEPIACALGYGVDLEEEQTVLVFDLGGGTLDVSILEVGGGVIEVLATGGDSHLGGDDWDEAIINWIIQDHLVPAKIDWKSPKVMSNLKGLAEYAKMQLSSADRVALRIPLGKGVKAVLTQRLLERLSKHLFIRARTAVDHCCVQAGVEPIAITKQENEIPTLRPKARNPVSEVLLVGGSTRMPLVQRFVTNMTGFRVRDSTVDPDKAVALGAAVQAGVFQGDVEDVMLMDVFQASLMRAYAQKHYEDSGESFEEDFMEDELI
ncbi:hypothetical protein BSKO_10948 [Bryopsis sp. KO-2023]|nr:hypothetical protein BSKO_10948 [Bryopsis sp. KO-2023]